MASTTSANNGASTMMAVSETSRLSAWPNAASLRLHVTWKYASHRYRLGRALYRWYVWPGFGARSDANYGLMMGASTFQIVR